MSIKEYVGSIVLEVDSQEIEITDFDVQINTGRKLVKTMNKTGRAKGFARGIATYDISVSAVIPDTNEPDWENLEGVKISIYPLSNSGKRTSYQRWNGSQWVTDEEARRNALINQAAEKKAGLLKQMGEQIAVLQDAVDFGEATPEEQEQLTALRKLRIKLNRIQPENAPDIDWSDFE